MKFEGKYNMAPLLKRLTRVLEQTPKDTYKGGRLRSFCEHCGTNIKPSQENACRFCRKSFCKEHWRAPEHRCKKRHLDPLMSKHSAESLKHA